MKTEIDRLFPELGPALPPRPPRNTPKKATPIYPIAVALAVQRVTCSGCGYVSELPSPTLMIEYPGEVTRLEKWHKSYSKLPKRIHYVDGEVEQCQRCFFPEEQ